MGAGVLALAGVALAQQPPVVRLARPVAAHPAEWTSVSSVRELPDGRVLVIDAREQVVKLADFRAGAAAMVGGKGNGPGEYVLPSMMYAFPGDSFVVFDEANFSSALVIGAGGKPVGTLSLRPGGGRPFLMSSSEVDAQGRIYGGGPLSTPEGASAIERLTRASGKVDTVGFFSRKNGECAEGGGRAEARGAGERGMAARGGGMTAFIAIEEWAVAPDGRVAVVCSNPYRVRIRGVNGAVVTGAPIPYERIRVTKAEKDAWRAERAEPVATIRYGPGGKTSASYEKRPVQEPSEWPDHLPPFTMGRSYARTVMFAPDGMLWVRRTVGASAPPLYDVIGPDAKLAYRVTFPARTRVVGFGSRGVYAVQLDDDDLQRLQLFALPKR